MKLLHKIKRGERSTLRGDDAIKCLYTYIVWHDKGKYLLQLKCTHAKEQDKVVSSCLFFSFFIER